MKRIAHPQHRTHTFVGLLLFSSLLFSSCQDHQPTSDPSAVALPADVVTSWLTLQLRLAQSPTIPPPLAGRRFAYASVALYEAIVPGLPGYQSIAPQLNGLSGLPAAPPNAGLYPPACANAALAVINRQLYPMVTPGAKAAIDSLETANNALYAQSRPIDELKRSADFGKAVAAAVFAWAQTDGSDNTTPYTLPVGVGLWGPTPPAFVPASLPNWGKCRLFVRGSDAGADPGLPIPYSEDPASAYFAQAKEVFDLSQNLTPEQRTIALFWADNTWHSILKQVLVGQQAKLDRAAVALTQMSLAMADAGIIIFKQKYQYNAIRPVSYIRTVMNKPTWTSAIFTPPHPEFPSGHAISSAAAAQTLTLLFGNNYNFTDTPYHLPTFSPRSYRSFEEAAQEASVSRVYGGIHYRKSCEVSLEQGKQIARNVDKALKFKL